MKLTVISDGTWRGTRVVDQETQEELVGVQEIELRINKRDRGGTVVRVTLEGLTAELHNAAPEVKKALPRKQQSDPVPTGAFSLRN